MRFRGLVLNRKMVAYMFSRRFRQPCEGCGRRFHFKGMGQTVPPHGTRWFCNGDCA